MESEETARESAQAGNPPGRKLKTEPYEVRATEGRGKAGGDRIRGELQGRPGLRAYEESPTCGREQGWLELAGQSQMALGRMGDNRKGASTFKKTLCTGRGGACL